MDVVGLCPGGVGEQFAPEVVDARETDESDHHGRCCRQGRSRGARGPQGDKDDGDSEVVEGALAL